MTKKFKTSFLLLGCALSTFALGHAYAQDTNSDETAANEEERTLNTIQVRGEFIPEPQRATSQVATFLAPEDLARQGDSNAALALTRLSGISIVSDKFAFVRGLGDRYSSALLNGSPLPSPEPLKRTVPLDLFPANALDGATVQKTYSAKYPAEFGGGVIDLRTLSQPKADFFNVKLGTAYNTESTGEDGIFVRGSDSDWTGFDDGLRNMPSLLGRVLSSGQSFTTLTSATVEGVGESLVNSPLSVIQSQENDPDFDGEVEFGKILDYGDFDIGLVGVAGFSNGWTNKQIVRDLQVGPSTILEYDVNQTVYRATTNALTSATLNAGDHEVKATVFYVHDTDKQAEITNGFDFRESSSTPIFDEASGWYERQLIMGQLNGEHIFGDFIFNWRGALAQSTRNAPYDRSLRRFLNTNGDAEYAISNNYNVEFSYLTDDIASVGADLKYEGHFADGREMFFQVGTDYANTDREYQLYKFRFAGGNSLPADVKIARPDYLFSPDNIDPLRFSLIDSGGKNDFYNGNLEVTSLFGEADIELTNFVRATVGLRYEDGTQTVQTSDRFGNALPAFGYKQINNEYVLPAVSLTWNFIDDLQLRMAYSQTISRPQFRELAPSFFSDPDTGRTYYGNINLVDTELTNYDARLEYYMGRNQFVNAAVFYKDIKNPIEETQSTPDGQSFFTGFINVPKAQLYGAELEYRTKFDFPIDNAFFNDREGMFSVNYTYTSSEIVAGAGDTIFHPRTYQALSASSFGLDGTQLQGTPENILNMQFGWQSDVEQLTLLLGWVDERILQRGIPSSVGALPDVIEKPGVQLDLVYNRDVVLGGHNLTFGVSGRNLLNEKHEETQSSSALGTTNYNTYDRGMSLSASVTAKFGG